MPEEDDIRINTMSEFVAETEQDPMIDKISKEMKEGKLSIQEAFRRTMAYINEQYPEK